MAIHETQVNAKISPINIRAELTSVNIQAKVHNGARGKSAYEVWLENGHTGSEIDFLNWLKSDSFIHSQMVSASQWKVAIFNYGGEPQSLIPYGYLINRVEVPINRPVDGFYTGVVGVDSANTTVVGEVEYITTNELRVSFNAAFSGKAYLN